MASESVSLSYNLSLLGTEVRSTSDVPSATGTQDRTVTHNALNVSGSLNAASTPPVSRVVARKVTLAGSTVTIDLTAAPTVNGTEDMTGKKLIAVGLKAAATNVGIVTAAPGGANPYPLFGTSNEVDLNPAEEVVKVCQSGVATAHPAVSGTVKNIDVSGASGNVLDVLLYFG